MKIDLISEKENKLVFRLENTNPVYVNTLRRMISSEVPVMAIEDVEIRKNDSVLYDEMLAHRLGLVVLATDLKGYKEIKSCTCKGEGCAKCTVSLILKEKGPKLVTAKDIKSADPKIKPVYDETPIVELLEGQELEFEAIAILGKGKDHVKWSPGLVYFKQTPFIKINNNESKVLQLFKESKFDTLEKSKEGYKLINPSVPKKEPSNDLYDQIKDDIEIIDNDKDYVLVIESWGQLKPKEMVQKAIEELDSKVDEFVKKLK